MIETSLPAATAIYACRRAVQIKHHRIAHRDFKDFSLKLRSLERDLGDEVGNEYWKPFVRYLKRYRFEVSAAPVGFGNSAVMPPDLLQWLHAHHAQCPMLYPQFAAASQELLGYLTRLVEADDNPLLDYAMKLELGSSESKEDAPQAKLSILLKESRLIPTFEDVLKSRKMCVFAEVVGQAQLRGSNCYETIACIGASSWFSDFVFSAPRAPRIHVLHFDWIKDQWRDPAIFVGSAKSQTASISDWRGIADENRYDAERLLKKATEESRDELEVEELLYSPDLAQISNRFGRSHSVSIIEHEDEAVRLFQLEGRVGVFLDADESGSWLVIDLEGEEATRVKRVNVSAIEPGMYVLLREGGGGDYIVPIADRILGGKAESSRGLQRKWKSMLCDAVRTYGAYTVSMQLKNHGSVRANEANVRNWMSERNIRTDDKRDFTAIMRLVGLGEDAEKYWKNAALIDRAHRQAGGHIRRLLLRQVLTADLHELEQRGRMQFELSESGGGQMLALRVVARAPHTNRIPVGQIGHLFELEEEAWRA
ncbi:MAG: hypothetical protein ACR2HX_00495 [Pyrinomonadaceae bacterium]